MEVQLKASRPLKPKLKRTLSLLQYLPLYSHELLKPSPENSSGDEGDKAGFIRSSSIWIKNRAHELPEIRFKCLNFLKLIAGHHHHRRCAAADFRYDPLSYSLNFEDGYSETFFDEARVKNFTSRFPASPPLVMVPETSTASDTI